MSWRNGFTPLKVLGTGSGPSKCIGSKGCPSTCSEGTSLSPPVESDRHDRVYIAFDFIILVIFFGLKNDLLKFYV